MVVLLNNNFKRETIISWFLSLIGKYFPLKLGVPLMRVSEDFKTESRFKKVLYWGNKRSFISNYKWNGNSFHFLGL